MITEAEEATRDREAADLMYRQARVAAMIEFDALEPQLNKMQLRIMYLRNLIRGVSGLLGDNVDEKYLSVKPPGWTNSNNNQAYGRYHRPTERSSIGPPRK